MSAQRCLKALWCDPNETTAEGACGQVATVDTFVRSYPLLIEILKNEGGAENKDLELMQAVAEQPIMAECQRVWLKANCVWYGEGREGRKPQYPSQRELLVQFGPVID